MGTRRLTSFLIVGAAFATTFVSTRDVHACSQAAPRADELFWRDGAFTALLAPAATVVRIGPEGSRELGTIPGSTNQLTFLNTDTSAFTLRENFGDLGEACIADSVTVFELGIGDANGPRRLQLPARREVGGILVSPGRTRVALRLIDAMDEGPTRFAILDMAHGRQVGSVTGEQLGWLDDSHVVVVDDMKTEALVFRVGSGAPRRVGEPRTCAEGEITVVNDATNVALLFEAQCADDTRSLTTGQASAREVTWNSEQTNLQAAPSLVSRATGIAIYFDDAHTRVVTRSIADAHVVQRYAGQGYYGAAALSPDGAYLALLGHAPHEVYYDSDHEADGEPTVEVFRLTDGSRWQWGHQAATVITAGSQP